MSPSSTGKRITRIRTTCDGMGEVRTPAGQTPAAGCANRVSRLFPGHCRRQGPWGRRLFAALVGVLAGSSFQPAADAEGAGPVYEVSPVGWVRKADGKTSIEVERRYQRALLGVDELDAIWVLYWLDRNDTPEKRSILQVHPRGDAENPLRGVFATRAPVRPNLIALSRCRVLSVRDNIIEIDAIDAFPDTPVLDIKP